MHTNTFIFIDKGDMHPIAIRNSLYAILLLCRHRAMYSASIYQVSITPKQYLKALAITDFKICFYFFKYQLLCITSCSLGLLGAAILWFSMETGNNQGCYDIGIATGSYRTILRNIRYWVSYFLR